MGFFNKLFSKKQSEEKISSALYKTNKNFLGLLADFVIGKKKIDISLIEILEESLYAADVGANAIEKILMKVEKSTPEKVYDDLKKVVSDIFFKNPYYQNHGQIQTFISKPHIFLIIGINGVGKTTTIAKLANQFKQNNLSVMLCAADTFRAAAIEQLSIWAEKIQVPLVKREQGADPSAVVYNAVESALAKQVDILIIDTAGRLHNKAPLMAELNKIKNTISKKLPNASLDTLLVLDGTSGQNSLNQLREFSKIVPIDGLVVTKLDGTSKGGFIISIADEFHIPIKFVGVGEGMNDLVEFDPNIYVESLFSHKK